MAASRAGEWPKKRKKTMRQVDEIGIGELEEMADNIVRSFNLFAIAARS